jgi:pimeloyl-ACP methyl ester carboxylesterase
MRRLLAVVILGFLALVALSWAAESDAAPAHSVILAAGAKPAIWRTLPMPAPLPPARAKGFVAHDGAQIYYAVYGSGTPVILLHGGLASGEWFGNQVPAVVNSGRQAILIDSRGHGRSTRDARRYTYELMASDVVAVMDHLKIRRAAVVGWSDGAIIGLVMALHEPERLTRVVAFAANMDPSGVKPDVLENATFKAAVARSQAQYARLSKTPGDFAGFQKAIETMWDKEPNYSAKDLARIRTPVAIVDGDHDEAIKLQHTQYLAKAIPGARLIILPEASHFAMLQQPAEFNAAMLGYLGGK